jgi:hypothetical protein
MGGEGGGKERKEKGRTKGEGRRGRENRINLGPPPNVWGKFTPMPIAYYGVPSIIQ